MIQYEFEASGAVRLPSQEQLLDLDNDTAVLAFTNGQMEDGTPYYAYVAVKPSRYQEFYNISKAREPMVIGEFGTIVACGAELMPPADVQQQMRDEYGFDDEYENKLRTECEKQRTKHMEKQEINRINDIVSMLKKQS